MKGSHVVEIWNARHGHECGPCSRKPAHDGTNGNTQQLRSSAIGVSLHTNKQYDFPLLGGQPLEASPNLRQGDLRFHLTDTVTDERVTVVLHRFCSPEDRRSPCVDPHRLQDAKKPAVEVRLAGALVKAFERPHERG